MELERSSNKVIGNEGERAVSPVIGVILMVAITVILAAVIAAFVLDIGDLDDSSPNAQYSWESDDDGVTVSHSSGDNIGLSDITITVALDEDELSLATDADYTLSEDTLSGDFTAGDSIEIGPTNNEEDVEIDYPGDSDTFGFDYDGQDIEAEHIEEVTVTWQGDGSSTVLTDYEP